MSDIAPGISSESDGYLDISGIDKLRLLKELWYRQRDPGFLPAVWYERDAIYSLKRGYIDYCCGKAIKMDLTKNFVLPYLYERYTDARVDEIIKKLK